MSAINLETKTLYFEIQLYLPLSTASCENIQRQWLPQWALQWWNPSPLSSWNGVEGFKIVNGLLLNLNLGLEFQVILASQHFLGQKLVVLDLDEAFHFATDLSSSFQKMVFHSNGILAARPAQIRSLAGLVEAAAAPRGCVRLFWACAVRRWDRPASLRMRWTCETRLSMRSMNRQDHWWPRAKAGAFVQFILEAARLLWAGAQWWNPNKTLQKNVRPPGDWYVAFIIGCFRYWLLL